MIRIIAHVPVITLANANNTIKAATDNLIALSVLLMFFFIVQGFD